MIIQKDFLNKLRDFGLNSYEGKLWTALLSRGISTAGELSDIANVPRSRSYDVLESLEKKGFIIMKLGKPIKYIAVPPSEVLERVKRKVKEDTDQQITHLNLLRSTGILGELNTLHNQGVELIDPTELSGSLKGRNSIYTHLEVMIKNAQKSVTIMTTEDGLLRKAKSLRAALEKAKRKNIKIKIAAPLTKTTESVAKELSKYAEVKNSDGKARFCIIDGKEILFMLTDDKEIHPSYDAAIWVNTKLFASTLENFFNSVWKNMNSSDKIIKAA